MTQFGQIRSSSGRTLNLSPEGWINDEGENLTAPRQTGQLSQLVPGPMPLNDFFDATGTNMRGKVDYNGQIAYLTPDGQVTWPNEKGGISRAQPVGAQQAQMAGEDRQRKIAGQNADLALKGAQLKNLLNPAPPALQHVETETGLMAFNPRTGEMSPINQTADAGEMLRAMQRGDISAMMGFAAPRPVLSSKSLTEAQGKAAGFAARGRASSDIVENVGQGGKIQPSLLKRAAESIPGIGEGLGMLANKFQSPGQQQVEQAQRDFVNAVLRQESGAAINESEFANARKQYFPQPNDSPQVVEQKRQNRETAIKAFEMQSGPGVRRMQQQQQQPQQQPAAPSSVDYQETMFNAKKAIARNPAAREAILKKMQSAGYDTRGL